MLPPVEVNAATGTGGISAEKPVLSTGADFDTFLSLLTTQLKNQDPLNPLEGHEFAAQLATFSSVEQQTLTNKLLGSNELGQAANWIGKEVRTTAPVWFGDQALTLDIDPVPHADDIELVTYNSAGLEIERNQIDPGAGQVKWFGTDSSGDKLPDDRYYFRIVSLRNGTVIGKSDVGVYARIDRVRRGQNGTELVLDDGSAIPASKVDALRNAAGN